MGGQSVSPTDPQDPLISLSYSFSFQGTFLDGSCPSLSKSSYGGMGELLAVHQSSSFPFHFIELFLGIDCTESGHISQSPLYLG